MLMKNLNYKNGLQYRCDNAFGGAGGISSGAAPAH